MLPVGQLSWMSNRSWQVDSSTSAVESAQSGEAGAGFAEGEHVGERRVYAPTLTPTTAM